jgi:hypothetical protein
MINITTKEEFIKAYEGICDLTKAKINKERLDKFLNYWQKILLMMIGDMDIEDKATRKFKAGLNFIEFLQQEIQNAPSKLLTQTESDKSSEKKTIEQIQEEAQMNLAGFVAEPRKEVKNG